MKIAVIISMLSINMMSSAMCRITAVHASTARVTPARIARASSHVSKPGPLQKLQKECADLWKLCDQARHDRDLLKQRVIECAREGCRYNCELNCIANYKILDSTVNKLSNRSAELDKEEEKLREYIQSLSDKRGLPGERGGGRR